MIKIKEAVIVEGKYDKIKLSSIIDAPIITTDGFRIFKDKEKQKFIRNLAEKRGLLVLTDSDSAGLMIRSFLGGTIKKEYFIRGDEVEYMMRCKNNGVKVITVVESLYFHPKTEYAHLSFFGKKFDYEVMAIWKQFFLIRNYVATYYTTANKSQRSTIKKALKLIFLGCILYEHNLKRLIICVKAVREGRRGIFNNSFRGVK